MNIDRIYWNSASASGSTTDYTLFDYSGTADSTISGYRIWTSDSAGTTWNDNREYIRIDYTRWDHSYIPETKVWLPTDPKELAALKKKHQRELKRLEKKRKLEAERMLKAQEKAKELMDIIVPEDKVKQLRETRRIEIVARNGNIYEILEDGHVNKLLPDGKKQGLCINLTEGPYPADDIIIAKLLLLENDPDKLEEIANKVTPFKLLTAAH